MVSASDLTFGLSNLRTIDTQSNREADLAGAVAVWDGTMNGAVVCLHRLEYRLQRRTSAHRGVYPSIALERLAIEHLDGYGTHPLDKLEN